MSRKLAIIVSTIAVASLAALVAVVAYPRFKKIEKRGPPLESVSAILPGDVNATAAAIGNTFNKWSDFDRPDQIGSYTNKFTYGSQWSHFFLFDAAATRNSVFPTDDEIRLDRDGDTFIERYVNIPSDLRVKDYYLYEPTGDYYWGSEYFYRGQPANFRCSFLIHLEPAANSSTRVEIFEFQPTIWVGKYLGLSAHAILPTMLYDIRPVESTTADRKSVLAIIQRPASSRDQRAPAP